MQDPAQLQRLRQPMTIAIATANTIRQRVAVRGQLVTPANAYRATPDAGPTKKPRYYLSPAYAEAAGLGTQTRWESSAVMHAAVGAKTGTGNTTGALWKPGALQVRNSGDSAIIEFGGSSLGASSTRTALTKKVHGSYHVTLSDNGKLRAKQVSELKRDEGGDVQYRRKPKQVRNAVKAGTVFKNSRIGLLQPTEAESQAQFNAFRSQCGLAVAACFGGNCKSESGGDRALFDAIMRNWK